MSADQLVNKLSLFRTCSEKLGTPTQIYFPQTNLEWFHIPNPDEFWRCKEHHFLHILSRNTGAVKLSDPVGQVRPFPQLGLKRCRAVIAHEGQNVRSGHWFSFVFSCESWWRVDTLKGTPTREDPFCNQLNIGSHGYTLDLFFLW